MTSLLMGPFGGSQGELWEYQPKCKIIEIQICYSNAVEFLMFKHQYPNGSMDSSKEFGRRSSTVLIIEIKDESEYLQYVYGKFGTHDNRMVIKSICFVTNKRIHGPYGGRDGINFSTYRDQNDEIVGFQVRSDSVVRALGAHVGSRHKELGIGELIGSDEGCEWSYKPKGKIVGIEIAYSRCIQSITFIDENNNGVTEYSEKFGGRGGQIERINIVLPNEYLTSIKGTTQDIDYQLSIRSICFVTNMRTYGPYGVETGKPFTTATAEDVIIDGFYGFYSRSLTAIGIYYHRQTTGPLSLGPFGDDDGHPWSYNPKGDIIEIQIYYTRIIQSITFKNETDDGGVETSIMFGGRRGAVARIDLSNPSEYIMSINGTYENDYGYCTIKSLSFVTNFCTHGPYGVEGNKRFSTSSTKNVAISGFHGGYSSSLNSIGIYYRPKTLASQGQNTSSCSRPNNFPQQPRQTQRSTRRSNALPEQVKHSFHYHYLSLTRPSGYRGELICDICDDDIRSNEWYYNCCNFDAHTHCVMNH